MEEYSLIANSGIQFYVKEIEFDFSNTSKQLFHEWFDEDEVQTNLEFAYLLQESEKVVRMSDLEACRFLDDEGNLNVSEQEVLANPNIEIIYEGDLENATDIFYNEKHNQARGFAKTTPGRRYRQRRNHGENRRRQKKARRKRRAETEGRRTEKVRRKGAGRKETCAAIAGGEKTYGKEVFSLPGFPGVRRLPVSGHAL